MMNDPMIVLSTSLLWFVLDLVIIAVPFTVIYFITGSLVLPLLLVGALFGGIVMAVMVYITMLDINK